MRLLVLLLPLTLFAKKPVTLADLAEAPRTFEQGGTWAPDGKRFVSMSGNTVRLFDTATKSERDLLDTQPLRDAAAAGTQPETALWVNRRARQQTLQWSPDSTHLLLKVRGDLFYFDLASTKWQQLTKTPEDEADPKLSPDGRRVAFRRAHDLYVLDIASRHITRLTHDGAATRWNGELDWVYPEELALSSAYWWSPDSRRVAYLQFDVSPILQYPHADLIQVRPVAEPQRYPQAGTSNANVRVGIVPSSGGRTRWIETSGLTGRVTWLPDSSAIAIHQLTRVQDRLTLLLADAATGKTRAVIEESDPAWVNLKDDFRFLAKSRRVVWGSERDGYRHLYLYPLDGGQSTQLTRGGWEVTDLACVDEPAERVFYVSTEASPLERQLYSIRLDGSQKRRLTPEKGTHTIAMSPGCGFYSDSWSSLTEPTRRTLHSSDGSQVAVLRRQDRRVLEDFDLLPNELVQFKGSDGTLFHARIIKPAHFDPSKKYPAIVEVYGGPHAQTVRDSWRGLDWDQVLAHKDFAIWQMNNRGSAGRGHVFEAPLHRHFGQQELADQVEGVRYLVSLGFVDPKRVGINGWSYGGYMTLYSLFNAPDTFRAGIAGAPVTDWRHYDTIYTERYMGLPQQNEEGYKASSPVHHAAKLQGKLLLIHNFEDDNVLFQHTLRMMDALQRAGKQFEFMLYPQKSHGVGGPVRRQMTEAMTAFFEKHLRP